MQVTIETRGQVKVRKAVFGRIQLAAMTDEERKKYVWKKLGQAGFDLTRPIALFKGISQYAYEFEQEI